MSVIVIVGDGFDSIERTKGVGGARWIGTRTVAEVDQSCLAELATVIDCGQVLECDGIIDGDGYAVHVRAIVHHEGPRWLVIREAVR